jgi:uncharacterized protein YjbI with pentapeptide repeats
MLKPTDQILAEPSAVVAQAVFEATVQAHERFLRRGGGGRAMLRFAQATGLDGRRRVLNEADFTGSNLSGGLFAGSHFEAASLQCADLTGCDLRSSNLRRADLRGARLAGASLNGAVLDEADMRAAYIAFADSTGRLKVHGAAAGKPANDNPAADFTNCSLRGCTLRNANLKGADFSGAILDNADLAGAKLAGARFAGAVLTAMDVRRLPLSAEQLKGCIVDPAVEALARAARLVEALREAGEWVESHGKHGSRAVLDGEDLRPLKGQLRGRALAAMTARGVCAIRVDFSGSEMQGAVFDGADLRGAIFDGADLRGASFKGAKLSHASFCGADLNPLPLPNGRAHAADFAGAAMERTDFRQTVLEDVA